MAKQSAGSQQKHSISQMVRQRKVPLLSSPDKGEDVPATPTCMKKFVQGLKGQAELCLRTEFQRALNKTQRSFVSHPISVKNVGMQRGLAMTPALDMPAMTGTILQDPNMVGGPGDYEGPLTAPSRGRG